MRKKIVILFLWLSLFGLNACSQQNEKWNISTDLYETFSIISGSFENINSYVGNIEPFDYTTVASKIGGKIVDIPVEQWDYVNKNMLLAKLDGMESSVAYNSASDMKIALQQMKIDTERMFDAQILAMQKRVEQSKSALNLADINILDNELSTAGKQIQQAQLMYETTLAEYNNTKTVLEQQEKTIYSNAKNSLSQTNILLQDIGIFVDEIFGISLAKKNMNDPYEVYLGAKDSRLKNDTKNLWLSLEKQYKELGILIKSTIKDDIIEEENKQNIFDVLKQTELFLWEVRTLLENVDGVLDKSMVGWNLTQIILDKFKAQNLALQNNLEKTLLTAQGSFLLGIKWSLQSIEWFKKQSDMQLELLEKKLALSKNEAEIAKDSLWTKSNIAKQQYDEILAGLQALKEQKASQLSQINSQITQLEWNQDMASVQLSNTNITAPFEWVIMEKYVNLWQVVGPGTPIFVLWTNKTLKVVIYVPENSLDNFEIGQVAKIQIWSMNNVYSGVISKISPLVDITSKKVPIEIKLDNSDQKIKLWMYSEVNFEQDLLTGLKIPVDYIKYEFGEAYIYVLDKQNSKKIDINVLDCNNWFCLVENKNLVVGDLVIK